VAVLGRVAAFVAIVMLVQRKVQVGLALLIGAAIVGLSSGKGLGTLFSITMESLVNPNSVQLILTLGVISLLGHVLQEGGVLVKIMGLLQVTLRSTKLTIMLVPSLIGTLIVAGGAIMSAPTVEKLGAALELPRERMAAINLVFRHPWFFVYPLIPGSDRSTRPLRRPISSACLAAGSRLF